MQPILCIIPARGNSKRVYRKNLRRVAGIPLLGHTINYAKNSSLNMRIVVSTEDAEIKQYALNKGVGVVDRPEEFAEDDVTVLAVVQQTFKYLLEKEQYKPAIVMFMQPGIVLVPDLCKIVASMYLATRCSAVNTVVKAASKHPGWSVTLGPKSQLILPKKGISKMSQELAPAYYLTGACFCVDPDVLNSRVEASGNHYAVLGDDIRSVVIEENEYFDFDTERDFEWAEFMLRKQEEQESIRDVSVTC